jgi:PEP-CTERM motif
MTTHLPRFLKAILIPGLLATWLCAANPASAAPITGWASLDSGFYDGTGTFPQSDLSGWFLTFDPSNEWTDAANIATMEAWLAIAEELSDNPFTQTRPQLTSALSSPSAVVPEPATLGLLGFALAILLIYVPIRRPHRSLRN